MFVNFRAKIPTDFVNILYPKPAIMKLKCLDRFRTMINVLGDSIGAGIVAHSVRNELPELEEDDVEMGTAARPADRKNRRSTASEGRENQAMESQDERSFETAM